MEALSTIETPKAEVKILLEGADTIVSTSHDPDREVILEAPKPPIFKGTHYAQEVENFLWYLENYFKCSRVKSDENNINTVMLYLFEMTMLWWRQKERVTRNETCTINTWEKFREDFKKDFFPNNIVYEFKRKFLELNQKEELERT